MVRDRKDNVFHFFFLLTDHSMGFDGMNDLTTDNRMVKA